jgi:hypothetical protein
MTSVVKEVIDYVYLTSHSIEVNWNKCDENAFYLEGCDYQYKYYYTVSAFGLYIMVYVMFSKKNNDKKNLTSQFFRLESDEHRIEFQNAFKQICVDLYNSELKSQELMDFI